jgi:hypothetical protein
LLCRGFSRLGTVLSAGPAPAERPIQWVEIDGTISQDRSWEGPALSELFTVSDDFSLAIGLRSAFVLGYALDHDPLSPQRLAGAGALVEVGVPSDGGTVFGLRWDLDLVAERHAVILNGDDAQEFEGIDEAVEEMVLDTRVRAAHRRRTFQSMIERYVDPAGGSEPVPGAIAGRMLAAILPAAVPGRADPVMARSVELMALAHFTAPVALRWDALDALLNRLYPGISWNEGRQAGRIAPQRPASADSAEHVGDSAAR